VRVLIITGHFGGPNRLPWLLDDLAVKMVEAGHVVDVIVCDPTRGRPLRDQPVDLPYLNVYSVGAEKNCFGSVGKFISYMKTGFRLHLLGFNWIKKRNYDFCITTSIAAFNWGFPGRIRGCGVSSHNLLFLWDFFPIHHLEIGRIRKLWLSKLMKAIERIAIDQNDTIALMSPANVKFFHSYHPNLKQRIIEIPPWASSKTERSPSFDEVPLRIIFGGQLAKGRGVDTLLDAALILQKDGSRVHISIAGDGPDRLRLERYARNLEITNVDFVGNLQRESYRSLASKSHIGIAITVPGISPPSFPSKISEYLSLGLPVIVCVEESSDAGDFVSDGKAGFKVAAGDAAELAIKIKECSTLLDSGKLKTLSDAALQLFEAQLSVSQVVARLEDLHRNDIG
jgi:glycosyltransferase involved in cell wall biosynthesis